MGEQVPRRVAIVGAGIGAEHAQAYLQLSNRYRVHTICDIDSARAEQLAAGVPGARVSQSFDEAILNPDIDLIDICLPPHMHFDFCVAALEAGKDVVCEKPLVASLAEADRLIAVVEKTSRHLFPVFQYRYGPGATRLQALLDSDLAGKAYTATLETHWDRDAAYYEPEWRGTWQGEQGGAILTHAIHSHDWLSQVMGPVKSVFARLATRVNAIEVEDCAAFSIEMQNGALATSSVTLGAAGNSSRLRFCFEGLTAESGLSPYAPASDDWTFTARDPKRQCDVDAVVSDVINPGNANAEFTGYPGFFSAVADVLDGHGARAVSVSDARRSLEFVTAAYASMRNGQPVSLPLTETHALYRGWMP